MYIYITDNLDKITKFTFYHVRKYMPIILHNVIIDRDAYLYLGNWGKSLRIEPEYLLWYLVFAFTPFCNITNQLIWDPNPWYINIPTRHTRRQVASLQSIFLRKDNQFYPKKITIDKHSSFLGFLNSCLNKNTSYAKCYTYREQNKVTV